MPHDVLHAHNRKAPDMAGYAHDYSKSNNAINAEECGLMTATTIAAHLRDQGYKGVTAKAIHELVPAEEWHHSSKMYNRVNYYDPQVAEEYIKEGLEEWKARRKTQHNPKPHSAASHGRNGAGERVQELSPSTPIAASMK